MNQAEALLNSLTETVVKHTHPVPDSDTHFIIDPYTRQIENTNYQKTVIMRGDHNSERFTFELPRYVDGHDMSLCNRVIVHFDNVGDSIENVYSDVAYMDDLRINPDKPDTVISSWLIRREATQIVGLLSFSLQYQCVEGDEVTYEWNTDSCDEIEIRKSKSNGEAAIIKYTNVLEEWRAKIFGAGDSIMSNITTEGANQVAAVQNESATQQAAIELKGSETLATIPDDYTEVYNMATEAVRTKADGIVCEAEGSTIVIDDASDDYIRGLKIYGKTAQTVTNGYQLFDAGVLGTVSKGGATITNNGDGSFTVSGNGTLTEDISVLKDYTHEESLRMLKLGMLHCPVTQTMPYCYIQIRNSDTIYSGLTHSRPSYEITQAILDDEDMFIRIGFYGGAEEEIIPDTIKPMLYQDGDGSWEPYTGGVPSPNPEYPQEIVSIDTPVVNVYGKNLWAVDHIELTGHSGADVLFEGLVKLPATLSWTQDFTRTTGSAMFSYVVDGNTYFTASAEQPGPFKHIINKGEYLEQITLVNWAPETGNLTNVQLEIGNMSTEYVPYVEVQSLSLVHTLRGIPVTSGGNYTDENGQQWICDEVDLARGVYVQRIFNKTFTDFGAATNYSVDDKGTSCAMVVGTQLVPTKGMCSHLPLTIDTTGSNRFNPIDGVVYFKLEGNMLLEELKAKLTEMSPTVNAILVTPIETPLTAEEIETFKSIKTNYPNTTILNNSGAWMKVKYNADIKRQLEDVKSHLTVATSPARIGTVTLLASEWEGSDNLYHQIVDIEGVTENSQVDLTPGIDQLAVFYNKDLSFVTENDRGVVTVYAIGQKPTSDYTIQVTITEVQL